MEAALIAMENLLGKTGTKTFECEHCGERSEQIGVMSAQDFPYYTRYKALKKAMRLLVDKNIEATNELLEEHPKDAFYMGDLNAYQRMDEELKKYNV